MPQKFLFSLLLLFFLTGSSAFGQNQKSPKLVVGIVVDQMRYDYLYRYWDQYSEKGFKKLINEGFSCENHHFSYMPTYTGPGHASVYTGTTPEMNGIIANDWWSKEEKRMVYCAEDLDVRPLGTESAMEKRSPKNLMVTTLGDQVKLGTGFRGKVIGISIKDRGAILPAGKMGDQAWWFTGEDGGKFVTSTYYMDKLPDWVKQYNKENNIRDYLKAGWQPLRSLEDYTQSNPDESPYEGELYGAEPHFPYNLWKMSDKGKDANVLKATPFGNTVVTDFALKVISENGLGMDAITDMIAISYSSPDYVGHNFGTRAVETQDTYLRLDLEIARLIDALDQKVGSGNYTLFLTADHGAAIVPKELMDRKVNVNYFNNEEFNNFLKKALADKYHSDSLIENISNYQIFLNQKTLNKIGVTRNEVSQFIAQKALDFEGIYKSITAEQLNNASFTGVVGRIQKGYNQKKSGDVMLVLNPGWMSYRQTGTTHGSPYAYDTQVPLLLYGWGIKHGSTVEPTFVEDIVPTITSLIHMQQPMGTTGKPIHQILD